MAQTISRWAIYLFLLAKQLEYGLELCLLDLLIKYHLTYFKHVNDHKIRVIDINKKDYKITCYNKHVLGSSRIAIITKAEKRLFTAKLEEIEKGENKQ